MCYLSILNTRLYILYILSAFCTYNTFLPHSFRIDKFPPYIFFTLVSKTFSRFCLSSSPHLPPWPRRPARVSAPSPVWIRPNRFCYVFFVSASDESKTKPTEHVSILLQGSRSSESSAWVIVCCLWCFFSSLLFFFLSYLMLLDHGSVIVLLLFPVFVHVFILVLFLHIFIFVVLVLSLLVLVS